MQAYLSEIFVSFQGEGLFAGQRHIFVRFYGCNLRCIYCDEANKKWKNLSIDDVLKTILNFSNNSKIISFTGGEPLIYADFIKEVIRRLGKRFKYLIETNSTLPERFSEIKNLIDIVSADIKLPQYCGKIMWREHLEFLKLSMDKTLYVKVVFRNDVDLKDFKKAVECVASVSQHIPFFIQPDFSVLFEKKTMSIVEKLYDIASKKLFDVRFLPQIHKLSGIR